MRLIKKYIIPDLGTFDESGGFDRRYSDGSGGYYAKIIEEE